MPQIVWTAGPDGEIDYLNRRWTEFTGLPQTAGNEAGANPPPRRRPAAGDAGRSPGRGGAPFDMEVRLLDRPGRLPLASHPDRARPATTPGRSSAGSAPATDIDGQKRAEESSRFLAEASAALAGVVDYESTLQKVANLAVPYFADWSAVDVADEGGTLRRLAVAHADPEKVSWPTS